MGASLVSLSFWLLGIHHHSNYLSLANLYRWQQYFVTFSFFFIKFFGVMYVCFPVFLYYIKFYVNKYLLLLILNVLFLFITLSFPWEPQAHWCCSGIDNRVVVLPILFTSWWQAYIFSCFFFFPPRVQFNFQLPNIRILFCCSHAIMIFSIVVCLKFLLKWLNDKGHYPFNV